MMDSAFPYVLKVLGPLARQSLWGPHRPRPDGCGVAVWRSEGNGRSGFLEIWWSDDGRGYRIRPAGDPGRAQIWIAYFRAQGNLKGTVRYPQNTHIKQSPHCSPSRHIGHELESSSNQGSTHF